MFSILILAISLSLDALGVGTVYGLRQIKIPLLPKLIICLVSMIYSALALGIGRSLAAVLPPTYAKIVGVVILLLMGIWIIIQSLSKKDDQTETEILRKPTTLFKFGIKSLGITIEVIRHPVEFDIDKSGAIDGFESLLLGLALSVDAIGAGVGSALIGYHTFMIPLAVGLFQMLFLYTGIIIGTRFAACWKINEKLFSLIPGCLMVFLALLRLC